MSSRSGFLTVQTSKPQGSAGRGLQVLAIAGYRSVHSLVVPLGELNVITGANGTGKSNLYRALRLLADAAQGGIVGTLAREGGLASTLWAGPEQITRRMQSGEVPVQGGPRRNVVSLRLGFLTEAVGYAIDLGLPVPEIPPPRRTVCIPAGS